MITFLLFLQPYNETVRVCHNPLVRTCSDDVEGPEICNTYYETACETTYRTYEVEQDEPVCRMEIMTKCEDVKCKSKIRLTDVNFFMGKKRLPPCNSSKKTFSLLATSSHFFLL